MDSKIKLPQPLKAKVMLWTDVSYHDMEQIDLIQSLPDLENTLCNVLGVDLPEPKRRVLLELYVHTVLFCRERSFSKEQTSALLSIIKSVHGVNIATPRNNIEQCFKYCKELLLCHSVRRPPFSINIFSPEEASCTLKYIYNGYVRHFKLYKYIFTPQVKLDLSVTYTEIQNHGDPTVDNPTTTGLDNMLEEEAGADTNTDSSQKQETSSEEHDGATQELESDLKALIKREIREQMTLVSGKLDQRVREIVPENKSEACPEPNNKAKK